MNVRFRAVLELNQNSRLMAACAVVVVADAFHAAVQPAGQAAAAEVVHCHRRAGQEEDGARAHADRAGAQTKDVQFPGVEGPQDCLQKVTRPWLLHKPHNE